MEGSAPPSPKQWESPKGEICCARLCLASLSLCLTPSLSTSIPPSLAPSLSPSLCLTSLAGLWFVLFSSNAICCYSQRLTAYKDGRCVYTSLECGITSTLPWLTVCVYGSLCVCVCCSIGRGGVFEKKRPARQKAGTQALLHFTFTRQFYYLLVDRNSQGTLGVKVRLGKVSLETSPVEIVSRSERESQFSAETESGSEQ